MTEFLAFVAEPAADEWAEFGDTRIVAWTDQPMTANTDIRAWVGDDELAGVRLDQFGLAFEGYKVGAPTGTDTLSVQIDGGEKVDTGLTVSDPPVA